VRLFDFLEEGIRPVVEAADCGSCRDCLVVCPSLQSDFRSADLRTGSDPPDSGTKQWGPVVALWEGHATDPEIRFKGSSGGALTALSAYCVEVLGMHGVLHIAQDPDDPVRNRTRLSRTREELLAATGSRYSPASVCNGLGLVEASPAPCVVIGKPSEIAAVRNARKLRPELHRKVGVTMSFFCAESPSTLGTVALLEKLGVEPGSVSSLRYRGHGWPGHFAPTRAGDRDPCQKLTYRESWGVLQAYRPWSVQLWPDGTGESADISCGDPWYEEPDGKNPGFSLVVARTERGREIIEGAMAAGYLTLKPAEKWKLAKSQSGLLAKKGAIWGRRLAMRLLGLPVTRLEGLDLWHCWKLLSVGEKLRATLGTVRRVLTRKLYRPLELDAKSAKPVGAPIAELVEAPNPR
jgi:coenzyme F420 hydrogenase subunit beta